MADTTPQPDEPGEAQEQRSTQPSTDRGNRFFAWMRDTGIRRQPGWVGGVAAGIGLRIGVDPIIVRGVFAVVAVLGGPALLLYAAAWLLLPDTEDRIHAEELGRGRFSPAIVGIGVMVLLSLLPLAQGFWFAGAAFWGELSLAAAIGRALWTGLVLAAVVVLIVIVARNSERRSPTVVPATTDDKPDTVPTPIVVPETVSADAATDAVAATSAPTANPTLVAGVAAPAPPPHPAADASSEELEAWKARQALWKEQYSDWKAQRAASEQELRRQRAQEQHERALELAAAQAERHRIARLTRPRIPASAAWAAVGLAIVAGAIAAFGATREPDIADFAVTIALAVGALVLGASIVIAGVLRRRSGGLSFLALLTLVALLFAGAITPLIRGDVVASYNSMQVSGSHRVTALYGELYLHVVNGGEGGITDVRQRFGITRIYVDEGESVRLELTSKNENIAVVDWSGVAVFGLDLPGLHRDGDEWRWTVVFGPDPDPERTIRISQQSGQLIIQDLNNTLAPVPVTPDDATPELEGAQP